LESVQEQFEYGDKVEHPIFGLGSVIGFLGDGERLKLLIKFRDSGEKRIAVKYGRLKRLYDRPTLAAGSPAAPIGVPASKPELDAKAIKKTVLPAAAASTSPTYEDEAEEIDQNLLDDEDQEDLEDDDEYEEEDEEEDDNQ
jgi:hypothetical protein